MTQLNQFKQFGFVNLNVSLLPHVELFLPIQGNGRLK